MFKKGTYQFNREPNFNFQLNRVVMWGNGDPEEVRSVSEGITDSRSWVDALTSLARKAEEEGRTEAQIGYLRMSEFFMYDSDPEKVKTYRRAKNLFYEYYADELMEHAVERTDIPYKKGTIPVMHCRAEGECRGRILLHGGNDSYIEEFYPMLRYFQENGYDVYLFEGPGQGGVFNKLYKKMMEKSELVKWNLMHGMYAYGAKDPVGYVKKVRKFTLKGVGDKVTQDMLILAGRDDHMIMPSLFCEEFDLLPNVRSLALQMYSNMDDAGSHCNMGNMKLALDTIIRWMDQMDDKNED